MREWSNRDAKGRDRAQPRARLLSRLRRTGANENGGWESREKGRRREAQEGSEAKGGDREGCLGVAGDVGVAAREKGRHRLDLRVADQPGSQAQASCSFSRISVCCCPCRRYTSPSSFSARSWQPKV